MKSPIQDILIAISAGAMYLIVILATISISLSIWYWSIVFIVRIAQKLGHL